MSYLLDLVKTFNDAEMQTFKQMDVIGKEEMMRDAYASYNTSGRFKEDELPKQLNLSVAHFDKINSVLLDKVLFLLYGDDYRLCLKSLLSKGLAKLMLHELKILGRRVEKGSDANKVKFYKAAFETISAMFHPNFDPKLATGYGKKYLSALGSKATIVEQTKVAMLLSHGNFVAQYMAGNEDGFRDTARAELRKWETKLEGCENTTALFYLHFNQSAFVKFYGNSVEPFFEALNKCKALLPKLSAELQQEYSFKVYCEFAFGCIEAGEYLKGEENMKFAFNLPQINPREQSYHLGNYLNLCLINKNYSRAEYIFKNWTQGFLGDNINRSVRFDALINGVMLYLHTKKFDKAFEYIQLVREYKRNEITTIGQVLLRHCETLYFYCQGDYKMAIVMANRNLRFLKQPEYSNPQLLYFTSFLQCLLLLSKQKQKGLELSDVHFKKKTALHGGIYTVFNTLL